MGKLFAALILCLCARLGVAGQQPGSPAPIKADPLRDAKPTYCNHRVAILDGIHQTVPADEPIIIIARLGDGDKRPHLNRRRLHNVRVYWTEFLYEGHRRDPATIILAEGERVKGFGRLEFYVGGKLDYVMPVAPDADLFVGNCYPPDDNFIRRGIYDPCRVADQQNFYPCRDKRAPRRRRR